MNYGKLSFLQENTFILLQNLQAGTKGQWGVMNAQEMLEHLADFFDVSSARLHFDLAVPEEQLPKYREFLLSEKPFRENTKAPANVLGEKPMPLRTASFDEALQKLKTAVENFLNHFKEDNELKTLHPAFGMLNYEEWVQLHHKHVVHHLKQFGLME
ncbi:MAG: DinB family protein [Ferruginibacter sp.]